MRDPLFERWCRLRRERAMGRGDIDAVEAEIQLVEACHPKQRRAAIDTNRRGASLTGRGAGKTRKELVQLLRHAIRIPKARGLYVATTKPQAEELMWEPLKEVNERLGIRASYHESKLRCRLLQTGSVIRLVGADDKRAIEALRGQPFHVVEIDEAASYTPRLLSSLIERILGPRLGEYGGILNMNGTPGHYLGGLFYDATRNGSDIGRTADERAAPGFIDDGNWEWSVHKWTLQDGIAAGVEAAKRLWAEALIAKAKKGWSDTHPVWMREYLGIWATDDTEMMYKYHPHTAEGAPWNEWSPARDDRGWAVLPTGRNDWRHGVAMDMGHGTPFALSVLAWSPTDPGRNIYQRYEFQARGMYPRTIAQLLIGEALDHARLDGVIGVIGWPDFLVADLANLGDAIVKELVETYGIQITAAEKHGKRAQVEMTNGELIDGRMHLLKGGKAAEQAASLQWRMDEYGLPQEPKHGDDAMDTIIYGGREIRSTFGDEPEKKTHLPPPPPRMVEPDDAEPTKVNQWGPVREWGDNEGWESWQDG